MVLFAEITAEGWVLIVTALAASVGTAVSSVLGTVFAYLSKRQSAAAEAATRVNARKIDGVQETLKQQDANAVEVKDSLIRSNMAVVENTRAVAANTRSLGAKVDAVHRLVNGPLTARVRREADALRRVADLTGHVADRALADDAERDLAVHVAKDKAAGDPGTAADAAPPK